MSFLARLSLANRGLVALIAMVVTVLGFVAIPSLKQQLLPSMDVPAAFVVATYPGAAPEIVEAQVVRPIESGVRGVTGLDKISSTASESAATLALSFEYGTDVDEVVNELQTALNRIDPQLPEGVDPRVFAGGTDDVPAVVLAVSGGGTGPAGEATTGETTTGQGDPPAGQGEGTAGPDRATDDAERAFTERLRQVVLPELDGIDGVGRTELAGVRDQTVVITPNPVKLAAARVAPTAIGAALAANGVTMPAGSLVSGDRALTVQTGTPIASIDDLRGIWLTGSAGAAPVRLGDVAAVEQRLAAPTSYARTNGQPSLSVVVTPSPVGNAVEISHEVRDRIADLEAALGEGAQVTVVFDQAPFVERSIDNLSTEGLLGLVMAVLVILVFLLSVRSTLVTAVSIPLSVVVALIALWVGDQSLNLLTLGGLTIAVGRVVDDSIVVLENIKRHLGYGEDKRQAIVDGVREVAGAVTASTLTTVAVFAPIVLVGELVGELFASFALTVTVALAASLLVSLTVIPVLAYWFLRPARGEGADAVRRAAEERESRSPLQRAYLPVIRFATQRRIATLAIGVVILFGTFGLASKLETNFIDQSGQDTLTISQELPIGTSLAATDAAARRVEEVLSSTSEVETYQATVGQSGFMGMSGGGANTAQFQVTIDSDADSDEVESALRERLGDLADIGKTTVAAGSGGGFSTDQLQVIVQAAEPEALDKAAEQVRRAMADTSEVIDVTSGAAESAPRVNVAVDRPAAAARGLSEAAVAQVVAQAFRGAPLGAVTLGGIRQDVVLAPGSVPESVDALRALPVPAAGGPVALDAIAEVTEVAGPTRVTRIDGSRSITVSGRATGSNIGATSQELTDKLEELTLPAGASYTIGGVSADQEEAFGDLNLAVLAAIAIVFIIMVATFRSVAQSLILLVSIPFAATGAIGLLLVTGTPLGVPALIGVLMLVGIVVTNAIVLMDLINQYRLAGMDVQRAVTEGGRRRLRPILMTAVATIFALLPMALGLTGGEGGFISRPLAIVVIGGLITSTLLTLVLVPTLYTMVEGAKERLRGRWAARFGSGSQRSEAVDGDPRPGLVPVGAGAPGSATGSAGGDSAGSPTGAPAGSGVAPTESVPAPAAALREKTDQFEVLRLPRANKSPLRRD